MHPLKKLNKNKYLSTSFERFIITIELKARFTIIRTFYFLVRKTKLMSCKLSFVPSGLLNAIIKLSFQNVTR